MVSDSHGVSGGHDRLGSTAETLPPFVTDLRHTVNGRRRLSPAHGAHTSKKAHRPSSAKIGCIVTSVSVWILRKSQIDPIHKGTGSKSDLLTERRELERQRLGSDALGSVGLVFFSLNQTANLCANIQLISKVFGWISLPRIPQKAWSTREQALPNGASNVRFVKSEYNWFENSKCYAYHAVLDYSSDVHRAGCEISSVSVS